MESLLVHPENAQQLKTVKAVLKALKVQFEAKANALPVHVLHSVEKSLQQYEKGETISLQEFKDKHFLKK